MHFIYKLSTIREISVFHTKLLPFALVALSQAAFAAQPPSAGSSIQQIPPAPAPQKAAPEVRIEPAKAPPTAASEGVKIVVNRVQVTGSNVYSEAELVALTGFQPGRELTLPELRAMAQTITAHYRRNGYFVAQAYLPAQDIMEGVVTIAVLEGHYGKVDVRNQSKLGDDLVHSQLDGINSGEVIAIAPLESRLLLLSDIPGVNVRSTLVPGAGPGVSDLMVDVVPGALVSGSVDADNGGNRYTGQYRVGATVNLNNLAGRGDQATLRTMTTGEGLNYARLSYQMQFGKAKAGVAYSRLGYELGREFESLGAHGTARVATLYGSYPLIRSRNDNLYVYTAYDDKTFRDEVDLTASVSDKKARVWTTSLFGDHRDNFGGGGASAYSLTWSTGEIDLQSPGLRALDAATARSNGHFNKLGFGLMRLQNVTDSVSLYGAVNGQMAWKNLDVSEKMELGGINGVRAYPEGEAYGDQGYVLNLEARLRLPKFSQSLPGQMQLFGFVDTGTVTLDKKPWAAGSNRRSLSGAGVGLTWSENNNFMVKIAYAHKLGSEPAISAPDKSGRFWFQAVKYF
jgi:hemolysin activation/secretion protein